MGREDFSDAQVVREKKSLGTTDILYLITNSNENSLFTVRALIWLLNNNVVLFCQFIIYLTHIYIPYICLR